MEIGSWIAAKLMMTLSSLFGVFGLSSFWMPPRLKAMSLRAQYLIIGGFTSTATFTTGSFILHKLGMSVTQIDSLMFGGFILGLLLLPVLHFFSNALHKRKNDDLFDVAKDVNESIRDFRDATKKE